MVAYRDVLDQAWPPDQPAPITIAVLPEYVIRQWRERILSIKQARRVESVSVAREHTVIADVPYRREHRPVTDGAR